MNRPPAPRYGIAEWFGFDIGEMSQNDRQRYGRLAAEQDQAGVESGAPPCPFLSTLIQGARCNKIGGVCSIRRYSSGSDGVSGVTVPDDKVVTVCPSRFLQSLRDGGSLFSWISEKMLETDLPTIVKETPFLRNVSDSSPNAKDDQHKEEEGKKAGRIDWILVNPATMDGGELEWCAVETQSLYFSGSKMRLEFDAYAKAPSPVLFPVGQRRPDYRSSGPKRLSPQLEVKVPVLRNWGKKVAVVIDRFFFENMNILPDADPRAKNDKERLDNSEVAWFVVDYDETLNLTASETIFASLENSRRALNATEPMSKADFTRNLKQVIGDDSQSNKVFKVSE